MTKWRIEYNDEFVSSPLTYWVHDTVDGQPWSDSAVYEPPLPSVIGGKGYAQLYVDILGVEIMFSSVEEVEHFLDVIKRKNMPTTHQLTKDSSDLNRHWLSRFPSKLLAWRKREKYIKTVESALDDFKKLYQ